MSWQQIKEVKPTLEGGDPVIAAAGDIDCDPTSTSYNGVMALHLPDESYFQSNSELTWQQCSPSVTLSTKLGHFQLFNSPTILPGGS